MLAAINFIKMLSQDLLVLRNKGVAEVEVYMTGIHIFLMCRRGFKADMSHLPLLPNAFKRECFFMKIQMLSYSFFWTSILSTFKSGRKAALL